MDRVKFLEILPPRKPFPVDLRVPRRDPIATEFANRAFGYASVDKVMDTFHRASISSEHIYEDFMLFDRSYKPAKRDSVYLACLESVRKEFTPTEKVIPLTMGAAVKHHEFPFDKSPGEPWRSQGYVTKRDVVKDPVAMDTIRRKWSAIGAGKHVSLCDTLLFYRAQICKRDANKIRAVFGYPTEVFCEEARFLYPYNEWLRSNYQRDMPIAYGIEMARGGMGYVHDMVQRAPLGSTIGITDWSSFDKTIPPFLIRDAFSVLQDCFVLDRVIDSEGIIWEVNAEATQLRWQRLVNYFINTPIRFHDGFRVKKRGGVPSGSGFTNLIDTIINAIVMRYLCYHTTGSLPFGDMFMGDDCVFVVEGDIYLDEMAKIALDDFGMILNVDKSWCTQNPNNVHFLGYYNMDGAAYKPQDTIVASFIYPERECKLPEQTAARALGQLWSCMNGADARLWLEIVTGIIEEYSLDPDWIDTYIKDHPNRFRFLRTIGIDPRTIGIPPLNCNGRVMAVEPDLYPIRTFKSRYRNIYYLFDEYLKHPLRQIE